MRRGRWWQCAHMRSVARRSRRFIDVVPTRARLLVYAVRDADLSVAGAPVAGPARTDAYLRQAVAEIVEKGQSALKKIQEVFGDWTLTWGSLY